MNAQPFVFMGGTFDPVHNGHLRTALEIQQWLGCAQVCLLPSGQPVHREQTGCSAQDRLEMVRLAVRDAAHLSVDDREVRSDAPSYSWYTLKSLREQFGATTPICMVMGMDAFLGLPSWYRWQELLQFSHLIVVTRPGFGLQPDPQLQAWLQQHQTQDVNQLFRQAAGKVCIHELTPLGISATQIRQLIASGQSPRYLLPDQVWEYIKIHQLYGYQLR
ncbi:nicotinate-nucleotide adenylyltransferase [Nitrincola tapanii]|nr:nicotinate-nucleotide adenylyltransferase [Nitrincola tapanii]